MTWADIGQIIVTAMVSAGGVGFIGSCAVKVCVKHIADALAKKYEAKLAQETERYKSELLKNEYVTKQFFDVQLEIYRNLNSKFFQAFASVNQVAPMGTVRVSSDPDEQAERRKEQIETAYQNCVEAQFALKENSAFISPDIYLKFQVILQLLQDQVEYVATNREITIETTPANVVQKTMDISDKMDEASSAIYERLSKYKII